ncbi:NAD(P)-binding protein [Rhizodiscina lignyota]|uniref:NAD(P)-binding protein n=1 Tax=Rhizodiscina lignyota TaxID=1504668 RepID=A0A9P4INK6_9PEZI|nr:NAD(P)-binding protein [Rhizodiscina lignyota]
MASQYAKDQPQGYNNYLKNIAIIGGTGQSGKWMVEALLKNGKHNITAVIREGSSTDVPAGVTVKTVDYAKPDSIVSALQGQDCLIITLGVFAPPDTHSKLVKAAADAKVPWILPNDWGYALSEDVGKEIMNGPVKVKEHKYIEEVGASWLSLGCGFWFEFSLGGGTDRYGFDIPKRQVLWFDDGEQRINSTTFPQIGRAVASLLSLKILPDNENDQSPSLDQYRNNYFRVSSFTVNQKEMFEALKRATGTKDSDWTFSSKPAKEIYAEGLKRVQSGDRAGFGQLLYSRMFFPDHPGLMEASYKLDNDVLGLPKEDLDEFGKKAVEIATGDYFEKQYGQFMKK